MSYTRLIKLGKAMNKLERGKCASSYTSACWDPIAYRCSFNDWLDAEIADGRYEEIDGKIYETAID